MPQYLFLNTISDVFEPCDIIIKTVQTCEEEVLYAETTFCARSVHSTVRHCIQCAVNLHKLQMSRETHALEHVTKQ